ncbi:MAG: glycosyltransferase family 4 protein [Gemmatimonadetes bacterium]|nr:glycosyltransferase family 4 protein [Gemmatimonadota bacterium]
MSGLRFAMVTTFYPPYNFGGDGIAVQRLSQALARRGHHVTVIHDADAYHTLHRGPEPSVPAPADGVEVVPIKSGFGALSILLTQQAGRPVVNGRAIRRMLDAGRFDVINFHNVSLVGGPGILAAGHGIKLYMAHEHWLVCPSHVLWRHRRELCTGRQCFRCVLHYRRPPQLWRYTGYLERQLRHVDAFIAMSEFSRRKHQEFGFPRDMDVVPSFLPDQVPAPPGDRDAAPHPRPFFLFAGRLEKIKGLDDVIPVFQAQQEVDLVIAGDGEYAATLQGLAAGHPRITFVGRVDQATLARYYRHAIALIVPSVCYETFGIILIEAFRQATPVLARRIGPFPEIVEQCGGGELFDGPDDLLAAMRRLLGDPGRRDRLGRAGYEGFVQHWSESAVVPRYLEVVRRVAETKGLRHVVESLTAEITT